MFAQNAIGFWAASASYPACLDDGHHWWYDPTDLTQVTKDGSNLVAAWNTKGIVGRTLLQASGINQPLWVSPGTIRFNGIDEFMKTAAFTWNQPEFVYMIVKQITWTSDDYIFDGNTDNKAILAQLSTTPGLKIYAGTASAQNNNLVLNMWGIVRVLFNGASSKLQVDATAATTGNFGVLNAGGFTLGKQGGSNAKYANIEVKDIICADQVDSAADEAAIYAFLLSRKP